MAPGLADGGTTYTATPTTQQFLDQVIAAECDFYVRCRALPDKSTCQKFFGTLAGTSLASFAYSVDQGRTAIHTSDLPACLTMLSSAPCTSISFGTEMVSASCNAIVTGTISSGGECIDNDECKPGLKCDKGDCSASCCVGTCVTGSARAEVGGGCTDDRSCVDSAFCKQTFNSTTAKITGICQPRAAVDAVCSDYNGCVNEARCAGASGSKTCIALAKDGAGCSSNGASCESVASTCDPSTGTCQPRLADGAPCGATADAGATAALSAGCLSYSFCKNGTCAPLPWAGEACSTQDGGAFDECLLVGKCVAGSCQANAPKPVCTVTVAKAAQEDAGAPDAGTAD